MSEPVHEPEHHEPVETPNVPEPPIASAAPHNDIPEWGQQVIASLTSLGEAVAKMAEPNVPITEPEHDKGPESIPWTHRGGHHEQPEND